MRYTIIVPTRNRFDTLRYTLRNLREIKEDVSILVCDNNCIDQTREIYEDEKDGRFRYFKSSKSLSMNDNWEFAISNVNEGMVTFVGDDDGLSSSGFSAATQCIEAHKLKCLVWNKADYHWPSHIIEETRNRLVIPLEKEFMRLEYSKIIKDVLNWDLPYVFLPCIYNSLVSINVIKEIRNESKGKFFNSVSPDVYSGIVIGQYLKDWLYSSRPIGINGASIHSLGTDQMNPGLYGESSKEFDNEVNCIYKNFSDIKCITLAIYNEVINCNAHFRPFPIEVAYLRNSFFNETAFLSSKSLEMSLNALGQYLNCSSAQIEVQRQRSKANLEWGFNGKSLTIDSAIFNSTDIHSVGHLIEAIVGNNYFDDNLFLINNEKKEMKSQFIRVIKQMKRMFKQLVGWGKFILYRIKK